MIITYKNHTKFQHQEKAHKNKSKLFHTKAYGVESVGLLR